MTIIEAISTVDNQKGNICTQDQKVKWLSRVEGMVKRLIMDRHEDNIAEGFTGYDSNTDTGMKLLVEEPFDEIYIRYLEAMIDLNNGEINRYNNAMELFNRIFSEYSAWYTRNHRPKRTELKFF